MKKILLIIFLIGFAGVSLAAGGNLYGAFKSYKEIRVYLGEVKDATGHEKVDVAEFREAFKNVLKKRINIKFVIVDNKNDADVTVTANIRKYVFKVEVIPRLHSVYALAADVVEPKSLARVGVDYKVLNPRSGKELLAFKDFTTEERLIREMMEEDIAYSYVIRKNIDRFIYRTFYKQKEKRR